MNNKAIKLTDSQVLRIKAEELLKENQVREALVSIETDAKKLLHELQVHQIELEMQNEELQEAYFAAERSLKKYTMLYDFAPMGYFTLNWEGSICELNFTGAEMLREKRFTLINKNLKLFISDTSLPVFNKFFNTIYANGTKESCEVMLGYDGQKLSRVYMEGIMTGEDQKCLLAIVDISDLKNQTSI